MSLILFYKIKGSEVNIKWLGLSLNHTPSKWLFWSPLHPFDEERIPAVGSWGWLSAQHQSLSAEVGSCLLVTYPHSFREEDPTCCAVAWELHLGTEWAAKRLWEAGFVVSPGSHRIMWLACSNESASSQGTETWYSGRGRNHTEPFDK